MNLQNGYKVIYEKAADGKRTFYASKTGLFKDAEIIAEATIGEYKLIYEKNGMFYGSTTGIPTDSDYCFEEFRAVFEEGYTAETTDETEGTPEEEPEEKSEVETPEVDPDEKEPEETTEEDLEEPADGLEEPIED